MFLYCNVGKMNCYNGSKDEKPVGGGSYNSEHIGHEVNNFTNHEGQYYGFVQGVNNTIDISGHLGADKGSDYIDGITVIWFADHVIVGYYKNARVYRKLQHLQNEIAKDRVYNDYNITTASAQLITPSERKFRIKGNGQSLVWYGNEETDEAVSGYIQRIEKDTTEQDQHILNFSNIEEGYEKEALTKARVNQGVFRDRMLIRFNNRCCLCGAHSPEMLIASHIKPWSKSDNNEKVLEYNGLLLCPNHDHLFDKGYISFTDSGKILISSELDAANRMFFNIKDDMIIKIDDDMVPFLRYHRQNIYKK